MARAAVETKLDTRNARLKLAARAEPYYRQIDRGYFIGYRKSAAGGSWLGRIYIGKGKYQEKRLGGADDALDADGTMIMTYSQAVAEAKRWFKTWAAGGASAIVTVKDACTGYIKARELAGKPVGPIQYTVDAWILPKIDNLPALGDLHLRALTTARLRLWLNTVATSPRRLRVKKGQPPKFGPPPKTEEEIRKRQATANRLLNDLKAILNWAAAEDETLPTAPWDRVEPFGQVDAAREAYVELEDAPNLVTSADADFRKILQGGLLTGARYSELARARVKQFQHGQLHVRKSKAGKERWISFTEEGRQFFEAITKDRDGDEYIFLREDGEQWGRNHQTRRMDDALLAAKLEYRVTFHGLRHTYCTLSLMSGMPPMVLAKNLGHADTRMIEKHYGHIIARYKNDMVEQHAPQFGFVFNPDQSPKAA